MADIDTCFIDYLERKGYDKAARAFRKEAGFTTSIPPQIKLEDFIPLIKRVRTSEEPELDDSSRAHPQKRARSDDRHGYNDDDRDSLDGVSSGKTVPAAGSTCRIFIGNLAFKITEAKICSFFADCGDILSVDWVTDKETGKFYGSAFVNFSSPDAAVKALSKNGKRCLERPIRINLANERTGNDNQQSNRKMAATLDMSQMPHGCKIMFMGNLSFDVTEANVRTFFRSCGPIKEIRFALRPDGEFKGCGFIEFEDTSSIPKAAKLHGHSLLGRPVRLDFSN